MFFYVLSCYDCDVGKIKCIDWFMWICCKSTKTCDVQYFISYEAHYISELFFVECEDLTPKRDKKKE